MQPTPVSLRGEPHGQRRLARYSSQGRKKSDTAEPLTHTHITWLVFKVGLDPIRHISIENISMYFFTSKNITQKLYFGGWVSDLTDKYNLCVLTEAISTSVEG